MQFDEEKLIKSPFNYIGGKYKLLPQILPLFPKEIDNFVDLFAGGCNVGLNVTANKIICNDINGFIIDFYNTVKTLEKEKIITYIDNRIKEYKLDNKNKEGFLDLRTVYNQTKYPLDLYVLSCYSFSHSIRFNNKHEFNESFGHRRFNKNLRERLIMFLDLIKEKNIEFMCADYLDFNAVVLDENDFVYIDPPYLLSTVSYTEGKRGFKGWNLDEEHKLLQYIDNVHSKGIRFALSNVIANKDMKHDVLIDWAKNYHTHYLNIDYKNSFFSKKDTKSDTTIEVLITNY
jgi:DNA adenine methylase Dam